MTDAEKELRRLARAAAESVGPVWQFVPDGSGDIGWVDSASGKSIGRGCDGQWEASAGQFVAAANPSAVLDLLDRIEALEADSAAMVADLHAGDATHAALATAAQRASAELRHALRFRKADGSVDVNLVSRAVVLLEEATTPGRPEKVP